MGLTYANIELVNGDDFTDARHGRIGADEVRNMVIHTMVDTGSIMLCINDSIKEALGLLHFGTRRSQLANGLIVELEVVGPVIVRFLDRDCSTNAIVLPDDQELLQDAASKGMSLDRYFLRLLKQAAALSQPKGAAKQMSETDLLKKINLDISDAQWATYRHLISLRRAEQLTKQEQGALIQLGNTIEDAHAKRMTHLWALAQLRGVSLDKIMQDFDIKPIEV